MIDGYELVARRILKERFRLQKFVFILGKTEASRAFGDMAQQFQQARVYRRFLRQVYGHLLHPKISAEFKSISGQQQYIRRAKY
jgi:hypothetical protein